MAWYLQTFHQTKDIFLEFHTSKATHTEPNRQNRDLRELMANQHAKQIRHNTVAQRYWQIDQERLERSNRWADLIWQENHFNFFKVYYLSHFTSHVQRFGSISMHSTEIRELAHKEQIKDSYWRSNKNDAARQIFSQYGRQHALGMRLQTMEALLKTKGVIVGGNSRMPMLTSSSRSAPRQVLKGCTKNSGTLSGYAERSTSSITTGWRRCYILSRRLQWMTPSYLLTPLSWVYVP